MKLSQAFVVSLCCLVLAGCATTGSTGSSVAAPALAGPDQFAAPPPPPVPPSTITVAPERRRTSALPSRSVKAPGASAIAAAPAAAKSKPVISDAIASADASLLAQPVRKGSTRRSKSVDTPGPQSSLRNINTTDKVETAAEVVPVSNPPRRIVDSRFSS